MNHARKVFQSGNKLLSIGGSEHPELRIESQDDGGCLDFEFESKQQLEEIIRHLSVIHERWQLEGAGE